MQRSDESGVSAGGIMDMYGLMYVAKDYFDMCEDAESVEKTRLEMIELINKEAKEATDFVNMVDMCL